ncbi:MAG: arginyltransferase [Acidobacteriota bacterium]
MLDSEPIEVLLHDAEDDCAYLPGRRARLPLRLPLRPLSHEELEERLERGDRRQGPLLYRPRCRACQACEAIRVDVRTFQPNRSQQRCWRQCEEVFQLRVTAPGVSEERLELHAKHLVGRELDGPSGPLDEAEYVSCFVESCVDSFEMQYWHEDRLAGIALVDRSSAGLSAVYTFWDPELSTYSLGTYSILKQLELCRQEGLRWLYLGLTVEGCPSMEYKRRFHPHERLIDGSWQRFERAD